VDKRNASTEPLSALPSMTPLTHLQSWATEAGLHRVAIAPLPPPANFQRDLTAFLAQGRHGAMEYLASPPRWDMNHVLPGAQSALLFWLPYRGGEGEDLAVLGDSRRGYVSRYVTQADYHAVARAKLDRVLRHIEAAAWGGRWRPFVDSAPVPEKVLAASAGMGFQGRHTNLIVPGVGSYGFLCGLLSTLEVERMSSHSTLPRCGKGGHASTHDVVPQRPLLFQGRPEGGEGGWRRGGDATTKPKVGSCGTCRDCIPACPTGALDGAGRIEARQCISYLTIEHRGSIPVALRPLIGNRIFGCDDCQLACPFNRHPTPAEPAMSLPEVWRAPVLAKLLLLPSGELKRRIRGTAMERIGATHLRRNVAVALGNDRSAEGAAALRIVLERGVPDLVREHVVWALEQRL